MHRKNRETSGSLLLECMTRICTPARDLTATAFSRPSTSICGSETVEAVPESPGKRRPDDRSENPLLAGANHTSRRSSLAACKEPKSDPRVSESSPNASSWMLLDAASSRSTHALPVHVHANPCKPIRRLT